MAANSSTTAKETAKGATASTQPKKRTAASEIDDIFSKKSRPATALSSDAAPSVNASSNKKQKQKSKKLEQVPVPATVKPEGETIAQPTKVPETVVDTSSAIESYRPAASLTLKKAKDMTEEEKKAAEEERQFRDSRGTRKKTEDGLPIYDTSELKIGLGGDTELCPFDCECCF